MPETQRPMPGLDFLRSTGEFLSWFPSDEDCLDYLRWLRWPDGFVCPRCCCGGGWPIRAGRWCCKSCEARFAHSVKDWIASAGPMGAASTVEWCGVAYRADLISAADHEVVSLARQRPATTLRDYTVVYTVVTARDGVTVVAIAIAVTAPRLLLPYVFGQPHRPTPLSPSTSAPFPTRWPVHSRSAD